MNNYRRKKNSYHTQKQVMDIHQRYKNSIQAAALSTLTHLTSIKSLFS